jgi:hypothetical protein
MNEGAPDHTASGDPRLPALARGRVWLTGGCLLLLSVASLLFIPTGDSHPIRDVGTNSVDPRLAPPAPPKAVLAPTPNESRLYLQVPSPEGPLGPLADPLPDEVVDLVNRVVAQSDSGLVRIGSDGLRIAPGGLLPRERSDMAGLRGRFYEVTILQLSH